MTLTVKAMARRVVIFGINYQPEEIGIAPYTTGLAEDLARRGWEVSVVTGLPQSSCGVSQARSDLGRSWMPPAIAGRLSSAS